MKNTQLERPPYYYYLVVLMESFRATFLSSAVSWLENKLKKKFNCNKPLDISSYIFILISSNRQLFSTKCILVIIKLKTWIGMDQFLDKTFFVSQHVIWETLSFPALIMFLAFQILCFEIVKILSRGLLILPVDLFQMLEDKNCVVQAVN